MHHFDPLTVHAQLRGACWTGSADALGGIFFTVWWVAVTMSQTGLKTGVAAEFVGSGIVQLTHDSLEDRHISIPIPLSLALSDIHHWSTEASLVRLSLR